MWAPKVLITCWQPVIKGLLSTEPHSHGVYGILSSKDGVCISRIIYIASTCISENSFSHILEVKSLLSFPWGKEHERILAVNFTPLMAPWENMDMRCLYRKKQEMCWAIFCKYWLILWYTIHLANLFYFLYKFSIYHFDIVI